MLFRSAIGLSLGLVGSVMGVIVLVWARKSGGSNGNHQRQGNDDEDNSEYGEPAEENKTAYQKFRWLLSGVLFGLACAGVSLFTFGCGRVFSQTGNGTCFSRRETKAGGRESFFRISIIAKRIR